MRIFIHYDNATKQLDCVYDMKPDAGKAFLHRINASGFDMANVSIAYRSDSRSHILRFLVQLQAGSNTQLLLFQRSSSKNKTLFILKN